MKSKVKLSKAGNDLFLEETYLNYFNSNEYEVIAYSPRQFEALRITYCATYEEFISSV